MHLPHLASGGCYFREDWNPGAYHSQNQAIDIAVSMAMDSVQVFLIKQNSWHKGLVTVLMKTSHSVNFRAHHRLHHDYGRQTHKAERQLGLFQARLSKENCFPEHVLHCLFLWLTPTFHIIS